MGFVRCLLQYTSHRIRRGVSYLERETNRIFLFKEFVSSYPGQYNGIRFCQSSRFISVFKLILEERKYFGISKETGEWDIDVLSFKHQPVISETTSEPNHFFDASIIFQQLVSKGWR
jgi:hypothetical protein